MKHWYHEEYRFKITVLSIELSDVWAKYMVLVYDFLTENFKVRSMGLVCDFRVKSF